MTAPPMSLAQATDGLDDLVIQFHNEMLRRGVKEMPAREWAEEFRSWINPYDFERQYQETLKWLSSPDGDELQPIVAAALAEARGQWLDAAIKAERDRCFAWAIGLVPRSRAAMAIKDGEAPGVLERDPSVCWVCGEPLHPGHFCPGNARITEDGIE